MPELLLEIFSEEIPARMQAKAEADLQKALFEGLKAAGLVGSKVASMSGPRRLTVCIEGLPARSADTEEERKGPKVGAPEQAVAGFLRGAGLKDISEAEVRSDPKKGDFYVAVRKVSGRGTADIVAELVPQIIAKFHWPKSMRTGTGDLRWVRPIQRILCVFDGKTVAFEVGGITSGNLTEGHRVHGRGPFKVANLADYVGALGGDGYVMLTREDRRAKIETDAKAVCKKAGLELVEDAGLLEEVVGLAEWPQVILGDMDPGFLELPAEVIQLSMRTHQKYFAVRDPNTGKLAPHFVVVANIEASDGGKAIAAGNRKVLSARLDDGRFFWDNDKKTGLEAMAGRLDKIDFKKELGSVADKVERVEYLARALAPKVGADPDLAERAARLCKADLVSEMVYEFPELQGVMGRYYALEAGEDAAVADAIRDHYKPQGPSDAVPSDPVAIAVALADKLDTLVGFWAIDEKPTGSKDPFALRRAALGVVRIVLENGARVQLRLAIEHALLVNFLKTSDDSFGDINLLEATETGEDAVEQLRKFKPIGVFGYLLSEFADYETVLKGGLPYFLSSKDKAPVAKPKCDPIKEVRWIYDAHCILVAGIPDSEVKEHWGNDLVECQDRILAALKPIVEDLLAFFADRLKQYLKDQGQRHDLIDAVFALGEDDLVLIVKRVEALGAFLETEDGANLLAGYKRAANILKAEEKKDGAAFVGEVEASKLTAKEEKALFKALTESTKAADAALAKEDFAGAMLALTKLRVPVDTFFDNVVVNDGDSAIRRNRLLILVAIRDALHRVADFSQISG